MTPATDLPAVRADDALLTAIGAGMLPDPTDTLCLLLAAWRADVRAAAAVEAGPWGPGERP